MNFIQIQPNTPERLEGKFLKIFTPSEAAPHLLHSIIEYAKNRGKEIDLKKIPDIPFSKDNPDFNLICGQKLINQALDMGVFEFSGTNPIAEAKTRGMLNLFSLQPLLSEGESFNTSPLVVEMGKLLALGIY